MAIKFQYDKTTIQELNRQLSIRQKALPILQNKETALRKEIRKKQLELSSVREKRSSLLKEISEQENIWRELPGFLTIREIRVKQVKIVGVKIKVVDEVIFELAKVCWWHYPAWIPTGIELLKKAVTLKIHSDFLDQQVRTMEEARKKTTQKVNLYDKVQIPEMTDAIRKIRRFLEDKENISRAAQKIMKKKHREKEGKL